MVGWGGGRGGLCIIGCLAVSLVSTQYFPSGATGKESTCNAGDPRGTGSIPGSGSSPGGGNGNPFQYSCLENPMDRGALWAAVHETTKGHTQLSDWTTHACTSTGLCPLDAVPPPCWDSQKCFQILSNSPHVENHCLVLESLPSDSEPYLSTDQQFSVPRFLEITKESVCKH